MRFEKYERKITLEYDEFIILDEKARKNDSQIIESAQKLFDQWIKDYDKQRKEFDMFLKQTEDKKERQLKKFIQENTNIFGYINSNKLLKELKK